MLVHPKNILKIAQKEGWALGAFNVYNLETALGVARAAVLEHSPIILQFSESTIKYAGLKPITHIVSTIAKNEAVLVPVVLHIDHGKSFEAVAQCIAANFHSVHIDASHLAFDENIALTSEVVKMAHRKNVWVQGELGAIPGAYRVGKKVKEKFSFVDPAQVAEYVRRTKVDTLAVAVGTAHGIYQEEKIHFDLLRAVRKKVKIPLVLHGGSGVADKDLKKAIRLGISIINIGTDVKVTFIKGVKRALKDDPNLQDVRDLLNPSISAVTELVRKYLRTFGSVDKSNHF